LHHAAHHLQHASLRDEELLAAQALNGIVETKPAHLRPVIVAFKHSAVALCDKIFASAFTHSPYSLQPYSLFRKVTDFLAHKQ
jgi:hypothetical protein